MRKTAVSAYAGTRTGERPLSFIVEGETVQVVEIVSRWVEEDEVSAKRLRRFTVKGSDGCIHTLSYEETTGDWYLGE